MQRIKIFSIIVILWHVAQTETNAQDFWQQTNGPYGGSIRALAVNSNGVVFAGTVGAGIFRSSDDGETWIVFNNILSNKTITALAINSSGDIFAGVEYEGVYRSADDGESWVAVNNGDLYHETVTVFAMNSEGHIFAGTEDGILYTTDNGGYWATLNDSLANTRIIDIDINSDGYIFALTEYRILVRSIDAGKTWTKVKIDDSVPEKWVTSLAINADGDVFASTYYYLTGDIFQSKDNGNTWTRIYQGYVRLSIETLTVNSSGHIFAASLTTQIFSSEPPPRAFVYRSTDNGLTWETFGNGLTASRLCGFIGTTSGHLITGNNQGVFRSIDNGETWQLSNDGLINTLVHALAVNSNGYIFAGTCGRGVFRK